MIILSKTTKDVCSPNIVPINHGWVDFLVSACQIKIFVLILFILLLFVLRVSDFAFFFLLVAQVIDLAFNIITTLSIVKFELNIIYYIILI